MIWLYFGALFACAGEATTATDPTSFVREVDTIRTKLDASTLDLKHSHIIEFSNKGATSPLEVVEEINRVIPSGTTVFTIFDLHDTLMGRCGFREQRKFFKIKYEEFMDSAKENMGEEKFKEFKQNFDMMRSHHEIMDEEYGYFKPICGIDEILISLSEFSQYLFIISSMNKDLLDENCNGPETILGWLNYNPDHFKHSISLDTRKVGGQEVGVDQYGVYTKKGSKGFLLKEILKEHQGKKIIILFFDDTRENLCEVAEACKESATFIGLHFNEYFPFYGKVPPDMEWRIYKGFLRTLVALIEVAKGDEYLRQEPSHDDLRREEFTELIMNSVRYPNCFAARILLASHHGSHTL